MKAFALVFFIVSSPFAFGSNEICKSQPSYESRVDLANGDVRFDSPRQTVEHYYMVSYEGTDLNSVCRSLFGMKKHVQAAKKKVYFSGRILVTANGDIIFRDPDSYDYRTDLIVDWIICSDRE